uniref:Uncharacterized protein n=2 Tax=Anguilla anguilla TaxID=7936 RepID=A0A0E9RRQ6_ANGAN
MLNLSTLSVKKELEAEGTGALGDRFGCSRCNHPDRWWATVTLPRGN